MEVNVKAVFNQSCTEHWGKIQRLWFTERTGVFWVRKITLILVLMMHSCLGTCEDILSKLEWNYLQEKVTIPKTPQSGSGHGCHRWKQLGSLLHGRNRINISALKNLLFISVNGPVLICERAARHCRRSFCGEAGKEARNPSSKLTDWRINREITNLKGVKSILPNSCANAAPLWKFGIVLNREFTHAFLDIKPVSVKVKLIIFDSEELSVSLLLGSGFTNRCWG